MSEANQAVKGMDEGKARYRYTFINENNEEEKGNAGTG